MTIDYSFSQNLEQLKNDVRQLKDVTEEGIVEETALRLEGLQYAPPVIIPMEQFLRLTSHLLLKEIDKIVDMSPQEVCAISPDDPKKCQDLRIQCITVQIYYYKKLILLRQGDLDAWDEIDELYVHD